MSGIYIPDVGLPQDGDFELWISIKKDGSYNYNTSVGWNEGKRKVVLVQPHGDLIDRDALLKGEGRYIISFGKEGIDVAEINRAPAIIPAEEGQ